MDTSVNTIHIVHDLEQGTPAWLAHRSTHFNASDAPAMLGISPYKTRAQLLRETASGLTAEVDEATQRRFDAGHRFEEIARPWAEEIIGEDLYPITASRVVEDLPLSASYDGVNMDESIVFEHKSLNAELRAALEQGEIPRAYWPQMEQQLLIIGAEKCLFMASSGDKDSMLYAWYESDPDLRAEIIAGWKQFAADLAAYKPEPAAAAAPVGRAPETLPALRIEVQGMVTHSNLDAFKAHALAVIGAINRTLETDEDFANAEATVKWCGDVESRLKAAKEHAQSQAESIDALFKTIDDIAEAARKTRLELDKHVTARKASIKLEIVQEGKVAYEAHEAALRAECGAWIVLEQPDFAGAIKGLRTVTSIRNAVQTKLANAKIKADESARNIRAALAALDDESKGYEHLFHDRLSFISKSAEDVRALVRGRISEHKAAEDKRAAELAERERARIRQEEIDRLAREQAAAAQQNVPAVQAAMIDQIATGTGVTQTTGAEVKHIPVANVIQMRPAADDGARMNMTALNAKLAPVSIDSTGLHALGFDPVEIVKASKLYRASDFDRICAAIVDHVNKLRQPMAA